MLRFLRTVFLFLFAGGGAWAAYRGLDALVQQVDSGREFHLSSEGILLVLPICVAGALFGAFLGGIMLPRPSS